MSRKMCKCILLVFVFYIISEVNSLENISEIESDFKFVCENSKYLSRCGCGQETDNLIHIPLFIIDCSRLRFNTCPQIQTLPLLIGQLDLSHNEIKSLNETTPLYSDTLQYLDISYNQIKSISHGYFRNVTQLRYLNLEHNRLTNIESNLFNGLNDLRILNLRSNELQVLPEGIFLHLNSLSQLILSNNDLGNFLEDVRLVDYMPESTVELYLDYVNLKVLTSEVFSDLYHLKKLSITHNRVQSLPKLILNSLEHLDISSTNISVLLPTNLIFPELRILKLNRLPYITNISEFTFYHLNKLEVLEIEYCVRLKTIDRLAFGFTKWSDKPNKFNLRKVSLAHNALTTLKYGFASIFASLDEINLSGNNWDCDCKLKWIKDLKKTLKDITNTKCITPETLADKLIADLNNDDMSCFAEADISTVNGYGIRNWLFILVGFLTLIVIGLVGLLIYMGPYGDYVLSGTRTLGPDSPYNQITIQPNLAEYQDEDINKEQSYRY